jgi:hypothetical protein
MQNGRAANGAALSLSVRIRYAIGHEPPHPLGLIVGW